MIDMELDEKIWDVSKRADDPGVDQVKGLRQCPEQWDVPINENNLRSTNVLAANHFKFKRSLFSEAMSKGNLFNNCLHILEDAYCYCGDFHLKQCGKCLVIFCFDGCAPTYWKKPNKKGTKLDAKHSASQDTDLNSDPDYRDVFVEATVETLDASTLTIVETKDASTSDTEANLEARNVISTTHPNCESFDTTAQIDHSSDDDSNYGEEKHLSKFSGPTLVFPPIIPNYGMDLQRIEKDKESRATKKEEQMKKRKDELKIETQKFNPLPTGRLSVEELVKIVKSRIKEINSKKSEEIQNPESASSTKRKFKRIFRIDDSPVEEPSDEIFNPDKIDEQFLLQVLASKALLPKGVKTRLHIVKFASTEFIVQTSDSKRIHERIMSFIQSTDKKRMLDCEIVKNTVCLAVYGNEEQWNRGIIRGWINGQIAVYLVDKGETIFAQSEDIYHLPINSDLNSFPGTIAHFRLLFKPSEKFKGLENLESNILSKPLYFTYMYYEESSYGRINYGNVHYMRDDGKFCSFEEMLIKLKLGSKISASEIYSKMQKKKWTSVLPTEIPHPRILSFANPYRLQKVLKVVNLKEFYITVENVTEELIIYNHIRTLLSFSKDPYDPLIANYFCLAPVGNRWVRGEVKRIEFDNTAEVILVDTGETLHLELKELVSTVPHISEIPSLVYKCYLGHIEPIAGWNEHIMNQLLNITQNFTNIQVICSRVENNSHFVDILTNYNQSWSQMQIDEKKADYSHASYHLKEAFGIQMFNSQRPIILREPKLQKDILDNGKDQCDPNAEIAENQNAENDKIGENAEKSPNVQIFENPKKDHDDQMMEYIENNLNDQIVRNDEKDQIVEKDEKDHIVATDEDEQIVAKDEKDQIVENGQNVGNGRMDQIVGENAAKGQNSKIVEIPEKDRDVGNAEKDHFETAEKDQIVENVEKDQFVETAEKDQIVENVEKDQIVGNAGKNQNVPIIENPKNFHNDLIVKNTKKSQIVENSQKSQKVQILENAEMNQNVPIMENAKNDQKDQIVEKAAKDQNLKLVKIAKKVKKAQSETPPVKFESNTTMKKSPILENPIPVEEKKEAVKIKTVTTKKQTVRIGMPTNLTKDVKKCATKKSESHRVSEWFTNNGQLYNGSSLSQMIGKPFVLTHVYSFYQFNVLPKSFFPMIKKIEDLVIFEIKKLKGPNTQTFEVKDLVILKHEDIQGEKIVRIQGVRGEIREVLANGEYNVKLVDLGGIFKLKSTDVFPISKELLNIPPVGVEVMIQGLYDSYKTLFTWDIAKLVKFINEKKFVLNQFEFRVGEKPLIDFLIRIGEIKMSLSEIGKHLSDPFSEELIPKGVKWGCQEYAYIPMNKEFEVEVLKVKYISKGVLSISFGNVKEYHFQRNLKLMIKIIHQLVEGDKTNEDFYPKVKESHLVRFADKIFDLEPQVWYRSMRADQESLYLIDECIKVPINSEITDFKKLYPKLTKIPLMVFRGNLEFVEMEDSEIPIDFDQILKRKDILKVTLTSRLDENRGYKLTSNDLTQKVADFYANRSN